MGNNDIVKTMEKCVDCKRCASCCSLLAESRQSPLEMAKRGVLLEEALSCSLCAACEAACPLQLSPKKMFLARRQQAIQNAELDSSEYRYLLPDRPKNVMKAYRDYCGIDYSDVNSFGDAETVFFPGCTLITYSPGLTREIYKHLQDNCDCQGVWTDCCGKLLNQLGLLQRQDDLYARLKEFLQEHRIKRVIVACPGCYYELKEVFRSCDVVLQTVYETIDFAKLHRCKVSEGRKYTVHDSCPDRFDGVFGTQVRQALTECGFPLVEMTHTGETTICCGSGGQLSHFRPDLVDELVSLRQEEARKAGAQVLVGYCLSCVLKYDSYPSEIQSIHALNLLLDLPVDYKGAKKRMEEIFNGPGGEKLWEEIMAD